MLKVFISYCQDDVKLADRLEQALKQRDFSIWIDRSQTHLGGFWLGEIDQALSNCDVVLGLVTTNYLESGMARKEAYAGMLYDRFIPLFFEAPSSLKLTPFFKLTQGVRFDDKPFADAIHELVGRITPPSTASQIYAKIQGPSSANPFRRVRAEYFDHDYLRIADTYRTPRIENIDLARGRRPVFIMGGRGSGKTMVLKSLEVRAAVTLPLHESEPALPKTYREANLDFVGIYTKSERGCFSLSTEPELIRLGDETVRRIFVNDFNLKILYAVVETLSDCSSHETGPIILTIDPELESEVARIIVTALRPQQVEYPKTFRDLLTWLNSEEAKLVEYVDRAAFGERPPYTGCHTEPNTLDRVCGTIASAIPELKSSKFYVLIDEYENLLPYQQIILNTMLKTFQNVVLKVAVKYEGIYSYQTLVNQQLQQHDYGTINLDFDPKSKHANYSDLLHRVTRALLKDAQYSQVEIANILEEPQGTEVSKEEMDTAVRKLLSKLGMTRQAFLKKYLDPPEVRFGIPLIFRILHEKRRRRKKQYAGFETYLYLSSGIIRYFLELCGTAFYLAHSEKNDFQSNPKISVDQQTRAAYLVSDYYLDMLADGLEEYGDALQRLVVDIGDIARERLLNSISEPEAIRIEIRDPEHLEKSNTKVLDAALRTATRESILHQSSPTGGYAQWSKYSTKSREYIINRIYTPALQIGYAARHRLEFTTQDLLSLLDPDRRADAKKRLQERLRGTDSWL